MSGGDLKGAEDTYDSERYAGMDLKGMSLMGAQCYHGPGSAFLHVRTYVNAVSKAEKWHSKNA